MGSGLAEVIARAGINVVVRSRTMAGAQSMLTSVENNLAKQVAKAKLTEDQRTEILSHISITDQLSALANCDLVIESILEELEPKQELFSQLDKIVKPSAILATNTSTLPVIAMAQATNRPDKVCGIHFFNPAVMMSLVEVIRPLTASDDTIATATAFAIACAKDPVQVVDRAGFIVNALLFPYLNNAVHMLEAKTASMEDIDTAMKGGCNFPWVHLHCSTSLVLIPLCQSSTRCKMNSSRAISSQPTHSKSCWQKANWAARPSRVSFLTRSSYDRCTVAYDVLA